MIIKFYYRQMFGFFFLMSFSIVVILNSVQGRNVFEDFSTTKTTLLICFGYGLFGLVINFLVNLIFTKNQNIQNLI